jgi:hypothetical protein
MESRRIIFIVQPIYCIYRRKTSPTPALRERAAVAAELDSQDRGQDQSCMPVTCGEFRQGKSSADTYFGNHYQYPGVPVSVEAGSGAEAKGETPHEIFGVQRAGESP